MKNPGGVGIGYSDPAGQKYPAGQNPVPIAVPDPGRQYDPPGHWKGADIKSSSATVVYVPSRQ